MNTPTPAPGTNRYLQRVLEAHRLGNLNLNVQDNLLNEFDRYTYKFGLYLVNDQDAELLNIGARVFNNQVRKFTVAESGVTTGFNIVDVEIIDHVSSSHRNRNNVTSDINITITEPYGLTLVDRMFLASQELGVLNWRMAPLILTLEMRMISSTGVPVSDNSLIRKAYKLVLSDMSSQLTEVGSTYKIQAAVNNAMGFRGQFYMLPMNLTINVGGANPTLSAEIPASPSPGAQGSPSPPSPNNNTVALPGTVGEFFQRLQAFMNLFYETSRTQGAGVQSVPFVLYEFQVAPSLARQPLDFAVNNTTNARRRGFNRQGNEIHVSRIGISELVDDIMASLADVNFIVPPGRHGFVRIPRVECRVEHVGWDGILNDYIRKFTFFISVSETVRPVPNPETGYNYQQGPRSNERQTERMSQLATRTIQKAYPYYYTGMNTEILSLDITFNHLHIIPLPLHNGATVTPADAGQNLQQRAGQLTQERGQASEQLRRSQQSLQGLAQQESQLRESLRQGNLDPITDPVLRAQLQTEIDALAGGATPRRGATGLAARRGDPVSEALRNRIGMITTERTTLPANIGRLQSRIVELEGEIAEIRNRSVYIFDPTQVSIPGLANNRADPSVQALIAQRAAQATRNRSLIGERRFVEDININDSSPQIGRLVYMASQQDIVNNMSRPPGVPDPRQSPVRATYSTILAQMYDRVGLQLTEIEMEIKGDPYWLGETNLERMEGLVGLMTSTPGVPQGNQEPGAPAITPTGPDPQTFGNTNTNPAFVSYHGQDAGFLLLFRAGNQPSETTGYMNFDSGSRENQSVFFNGVYLAVEVTHVFSNGKFTQKIRAQRDNLIDLNRIGTANPATPAPEAAPVPAPAPTPPRQPEALRPPVATAPVQGPNESPGAFARRSVGVAEAILAERERGGRAE
jgi:hypothetical protein